MCVHKTPRALRLRGASASASCTIVCEACNSPAERAAVTTWLQPHAPRARGPAAKSGSNITVYVACTHGLLNVPCNMRRRARPCAVRRRA
ncbi:hypothetical protein EON67_03550 [archaeon]|nr:MAG: hypothetical protein EON67_03550 [archaeon]